jgi:Ca2+-binding EF-hand superfamily protein
MVGLLEKFDRWDYNGDGYLTASELKDAERLSGLPVDEIIGFYDADKDGRISFREAQAGMTRVGEAREVVEELQP